MGQTDVFRHTEIGTERQFLMNNAHACALGLKRGTKTPDHSVNFKMTFIRLMDAGQNLPQSALAGAVLSHERVADSRPHVKTHFLKRHGSGESFTDAAKANCGDGGFGTQENKLKQTQFMDWVAEAVLGVAQTAQMYLPTRQSACRWNEIRLPQRPVARRGARHAHERAVVFLL